MNKKYCIFAIILLLLSGKISVMSAELELGGFQVDMGTGENTDLPWDWEESAGNPEVQEEFRIDTEPLEEEGGGENSYPIQENIENNYGSENGTPVNGTSVNADSSQETFWSGVETQRMWEITPANTPAATPLPTLMPSPSPLPLATAVPSPISPAPSAYPDEINNRRKHSPGSWKSEEVPQLICWKGETDRNPCFKIRGNREVQILYLKINGKDIRWKWQGDRIVPEQKSRQESPAEKVVTELAVLDYGNHAHGIFIDEKNKS